MSDKTLFPMPEKPEPETGVTRYLPKEWCDDYNPLPQADPNAFLRQHEGKWLLVPVEDDIEDADPHCIVVAHGDLITFESNRLYGRREITVEADGEYVLSEPFPDDANCFCLWANDYDSMMPSIPALIANEKENAPLEWTPPYKALIEAWFWGETTTFRVVIEEGAARLDRLPEPPLVMPYTNWRGVTATRRLRPIAVKHKATEWHREPQWILDAYDYDRQEMRGFAMRDFGAKSAEAELAKIEAMLAEGQGEDCGLQILPDFTEDMTTAAKVEACLHLLEKRRDVIEATFSAAAGG